MQELHEYRNTSLVSTKIYDLTILKNMYIDKKFRGYITHNPLEETESVNQMIDINLKKKGSLQNGNDTYIFLLGAEEISRLYKLFGDRLFLKNVRNPLKVEANIAIERSAQEDTNHFLGYNNGITIITKEVRPFYPENDKITIDGMQVINGAQTFKSIANAYDKANRANKKSMKDNLAIVMKIIAVDDSDLERNIIKYTNTQTAIIQRDYHSNDRIQEKIYFDLLRNTDIVYQRKRGEFSESAKGKINIVSNEDMAQCYLAFYLQNPHLARTQKRQIFDEVNGVYEDIFNNDTDYRNLYNSYYVVQFVANKLEGLKKEDAKKYKLLKFGKYYIAAFIKQTYLDFDTTLNKAYKGELAKGKEKDKKAMANAILFSKLKEKKDSSLEDAFNKAITYILDFSEKRGYDENFYKRGESYDNLLRDYKEELKKQSVDLRVTLTQILREHLNRLNSEGVSKTTP